VALHGTYAGPPHTEQSIQRWRAQFPQPLSRGAVAFRAILDRQIIHVRDVDADPELMQSVRDLGVRSIVAIPIFRDGEVIGSISINADTPGGFSDSQLELLQTFAEQAVIAITSAETYRELQARTAALAQRNTEYGERIEQQAATIDVLKVMSSSPGNVQPIFEQIVERARTFCDGDIATVALVKREALHVQARTSLDDEYNRAYDAAFPRPIDMSSAFGRAILARDAVQLIDVRTDKHHFMAGKDAGSILGVPIMRWGEPIGAIAIGRRMPGGYSDTEVQLLRTFADQAAIALGSAETYGNLQEALEQQTATSEVLAVINASPGDLAPVFDAMLEKATRLCQAEMGTLWTYDGEYMQPVAMRGVPPAYSDFLKRGPHRPNSTQSRILRGEQVTQAIDITESEAYRSGDPLARAGADLGGIRTVLVVPLRKDETALGTIGIYRQEPRPFTEKQIALLQNFAAQAVIAMDNARLLAEQREALEEQTATAEVLQVINSSPGDLAPVFDAMLERALRLCEASFGIFYIRDGERLSGVITRNLPQSLVDIVREPFQPSPVGFFEKATRGQAFEHVTDMSADASRISGDPRVRALVELGGARTVLSVALYKDGAVLGWLGFYRTEVKPFTDKQIALLQSFAAQAVIAMENARLLTETREALEQQTATAEVLGVINSSPGDLTPVFNAMLDKALRLCEASLGNVLTYDGQRFSVAANRGHPQFDEWLRGLGAFVPEVGSTNERIVHGESIIEVRDLANDPASTPENPIRRGLIEIGGFRSCVSVALRKEWSLLGVLHIFREEVRQFSKKEIALLQNFAAQAVIAMENARLITEQREALERQTATAEVLQVINASPGNLAPVFDVMLDRAMRLCEGVQGTLWMFDGERMRATATAGYSSELAKQLSDWREIHPFQRRLSQGERAFQIIDLAAEELYRSGNPLTRAAVDIAGIRSVVFVALVKDALTLGGLTIGRREVRAFTDKQITLLEDFAAQAVIAMESARLITEQREALEQQTATAEVLQVINASPGELRPVFDAILEKATGLCECAFGILGTYDGARFRHVALRNVPTAYAEFMGDEPRTYAPATGPAQAVEQKRVIYSDDLVASDAYRSGDPNRRAVVDLAGARTSLIVPLLKDDQALGIINVFRQEVRPFTDKQIALLENFAAQAVIAMENARLLTEQREALEQQTATAEVLQVINSSPGELAPVFDAILEKATRLCEATFGEMHRFDGEILHTVALRNVPEALTGYLTAMPIRPDPERSFLGKAVHEQRTIHVADLTAEEPYLNRVPLAVASAELGGVRTFLHVPLLKDDVVLGVLTVFRQEVRPFTDKQVALLQNFAAQAAIAMENARLLDEIRQRQEELRVTFENMGDGVALFDETRRLVASNQQFQDMLNVPDDVISSRPAFADYIRYLADRGEYGPDPEDHVQHLLALGSQPAAFERTRPNGRIIEVRGNPVPGGGFVAIYSDITGRKRNEQELRAARDAAEEASRTIEAAYRDLKAAQASLIQAEKMASLGQLTAGIAHEIKNPLNFVNNFAELSVDLLDELNEAVANHRQAEVEDLTGTLKGNLGKIAEHGKRADGIVRGMLEHSRGSAGEQRSVNLNTLVDEALTLAYHGARAQDQSFNVTLQRDLAAGMAPITLTPQDITRVLLNLFSNGFYAARSRQQIEKNPGFEPTLRVVTRELGDGVEIRVRDNGIGIPVEIRDKLFQPFFTTKPTGEGTGLGLSISYDIITQQHGGSITVESEPGSFTVFTVCLPR
jgi:GAF domain-containing protein/nitrogen-specific signal transduction histidine kinase